jgi:hypothetical protein
LVVVVAAALVEDLLPQGTMAPIYVAGRAEQRKTALLGGLS